MLISCGKFNSMWLCITGMNHNRLRGPKIIPDVASVKMNKKLAKT